MIGRLARGFLRVPGGCGAVGQLALVSLLAAGLSTGAAVSPAAAAQVGALSELNIPYLHYFGFGAFKVGEANVWAVRLRVTPSLIDYKPRKVGLALRLSSSLIGIQPNSDLIPDVGNIGIVTLTAGAEVRVNVNDRSLIRMFGDVGAALDTRSDTTGALGGFGALWELVFPWKEWELGLQPSADFLWSTTSAERLNDHLFSFQVKFDARHNLGFHMFGNRAQLGGYVDLAHFDGDTDVGSGGTRRAFGDTQYELGVIFGTHPRKKFILFRPLLNVGYRWGENFRGIRIGLGDLKDRG